MRRLVIAVCAVWAFVAISSKAAIAGLFGTPIPDPSQLLGPAAPLLPSVPFVSPLLDPLFGGRGPRVNIPKCIEGLLTPGGILPPLLGGFPPIPAEGCIEPNGARVAPPGPQEQIAGVLNAVTNTLRDPNADDDTADWIAFTSAFCDASWHQICRFDALISLPSAKWQICKVIDKDTRAGQVTIDQKTGRWFAADPLEPIGYRSVRVLATASGNNVPPVFPGASGAKLSLSDLGAKVISAKASTEQRMRAGCVFSASP